MFDFNQSGLQAYNAQSGCDKITVPYALETNWIVVRELASKTPGLKIRRWAEMLHNIY